MSRKNDNTWKWGLGIGVSAIAVVAILVMQFISPSTFNIFGYTYNYQTPYTPDNIVNQYNGYNVILQFSQNVVCSGSPTTGILDTSLPSGSACTTFVNYQDSGYKVYESYKVDNNGDYSKTVSVNPAGYYIFRVICCDNNDNCKMSNTATLNVNLCNQPPQQQGQATCTDSDGGQDDQFLHSGTCESSVSQIGNIDSCVDTQYQKEWYCDSNKECKFTVNKCENGWWCVGGACVQPQCAQILNPTSQESCDVGYCGNGDGCDFEPATLTMPAKCQCVV